MKKINLIVLVAAGVLGLAACGGGSNSASTDAASTTNQSAAVGTESVANAPKSKGEGLMASSDCGTCHKPDVKLVGPAFKDIAAKYDQSDATVAKLADKIIKGGSGSWGDVAMSPHGGLSEDDAKEMAKYILSVK
ncbi:cytochrome c [Mucilaginibacter yixingensis]|uniref:Cytochrome c n=1 Tax=Mucilaginibacter yixingensis TaxID=1295612 RepID=A0A2T5JGH1_9SPHI|nr:c-type cytochrome [Mucilaginibacter yixingensis]PTR01501.1 cytochrome c [Mucilaginibacter yixingensis]